ncbi:MAG: cell division protein ZapA [Sphingomonadales bacterium 32-68-7]|nr:MAG: cell division protein ZapA [Sphingomonadales bacterium 12-68-11]OYX09166.1 MAG: cell division protein ZapA [Sphingomonadales bacterium 32-68-7]
MSNVTLSIGGRNYTVACADGEESHIARLGQLIDGKLAGMAGQSEPRTLLFAALLLADELHEARGGGPPPAAAATAPASPQHAEALEALAERLEHTAAVLENAGAKA